MIVCVTGGKGGPGATVLACGLAGALARSGRRVLLIDGDPWGGDVGAYLQPCELDPSRGLLPLLRLDRGPPAAPAIARETTEVAENFHVLMGLPRSAPELLAGGLEQLARDSRELADVVVVDLGAALAGSPAAPLVGVADTVLLAARPDLQGALASERALVTLGETLDVELVATRVRGGAMADVVELSEALQCDIRLSVPESSRIQSVAISPQRHIRRALDRMAEAVTSSSNGPSAEIEPVEEAASREP